MTYQELEIKRSYVSVGQENIAKSFLTPALKCTKVSGSSHLLFFRLL